MSRLQLDTFAHAAAHLNDDLTSPALRRPRVSILHRAPLGWTYIAAPKRSMALRERNRRLRSGYLGNGRAN